MFSQLKSSINGMDISDDIKTKLVSMVTNVETSANERFDTVKESRDNEKSKRQSLQTRLDEVGSTLKLNDDFTAEDVKAKMTSNNSNADVEKVKAEMQLRYDTDTKELSSKIAEGDGKFNELQTKHSDFVFMNEISNSGLLSKFVDEPMARSNIMDMIRDKSTRGEDGKIYAKDSITGNVLKDINNGNAPLGLDYLVNDIASTINPMYLAPQGNGGGGGANHNQGNHSGGKSWAEMTGGEKVALFKKDPKLYEQLKNS